MEFKGPHADCMNTIQHLEDRLAKAEEVIEKAQKAIQASIGTHGEKCASQDRGLGDCEEVLQFREALSAIQDYKENK